MTVYERLRVCIDVHDGMGLEGLIELQDVSVGLQSDKYSTTVLIGRFYGFRVVLRQDFI